MQGPKPSLASLQLRSTKLVESSLAHNTNSTYKTALESFDRFRTLYHLPLLWPAEKNQIVLFISYCFEQGYAPSTITTYIAGIGFKHKLNSWYDPIQLFVIKKMLEGCKRSKKQGDLRSPVTPKMLEAICGNLIYKCYSEFEAILFRSVYLLAYYGLMRVSELVFTSVLQADRPLQFKDVRFMGKSVVQLSIRISKNNQRGHPTLVRIPCITKNELCPVCSLRNYLHLRPQQSGQLFVHANGTSLTRSQFSGVLVKSIKGSIYESKHIKSHSFRIGRTSELASMGVEFETIKAPCRPPI